MYPDETFSNAKTRRYYLLMLIFSLLLVAVINIAALAVPADTIEVVAKHPESGRSSVYQISFQVSKPIPAKAIIRVTFPDNFDLSELMIAGSTTIDGGFELDVNKQVLTLKRSGLGREIRANEKVDVKFAIVKNPKQPADNYRIVVEILDESEKSLVKKERLHKIIPSKE